MWKNYQWRLGVLFQDRLQQNGFVFIFEIFRVGKEKENKFITDQFHDKWDARLFITRLFITSVCVTQSAESREELSTKPL